MTKKKTSNRKKILLRTFFILIFLLAAGGAYIWYSWYQIALKPNVILPPVSKTYLYIPTGSTFEDVKNQLFSRGLIENKSSFEWLAEKKNYVNQVKPGKYRLRKNMSNNDLINMLRSGEQEPVKITFQNFRKKEQIAQRVGRLLECDSLQIITLLNDSMYLLQFGVTPSEAISLFIPNTYELFWNTSAQGFIKRMYTEFKKFWNVERLAKARQANLTPVQVITLASIIQQETNKTDEMSRIAGVYINRLQRGQPLEADPTVKFALNDFGIKRLLFEHLQIESPYNTYKNAGLPPGPICMPDAITIDKTLEYEHHDYYYFCAKDDMSGYHSFSKTYEQHLQNARKYHQALNKRNIR